MHESPASGRLRSCIGEDNVELVFEQLEILLPLHEVVATSDLAAWPLRLEQGMQLVSKSFRSFPSYMSEQRLVCGGSISRPGPTWDDTFSPVSCRLRNPFPTLGDDTSEQRLEPKRAAGKIHQTLTILTTCLAQSKGSCVASAQMPLKHGSRKDFLFSVAGQTDTSNTPGHYKAPPCLARRLRCYPLFHFFPRPKGWDCKGNPWRLSCGELPRGFCRNFMKQW